MHVSKPIIYFHIVGWLFFLSLPLIFIASQSQYQFSDLHWLPLCWAYFSIYPVIFYLHTFFLFPALYLRKKYLLYVCTLLVLSAAIFFIRPFDRTISSLHGPVRENAGQQHVRPSYPADNNRTSFSNRPMPGDNHFAPPAFSQPPGMPPNHPDDNRPMLDIVSILFLVLTIGLSITFQATQRWRQAVRLAAQAETDKVNAELSFLKAQINPHFLFNTLNNIYALALNKDDHTADSIMRLSNIMRYVTDEVSNDFVPLQNEMDCITDYIDLQRLRLTKKAAVEFTATGDLSTTTIAPLVLMTFIENTFKYGISNHQPSPVIIRLEVSALGISFFCQNRIFPVTDVQDERSGIGISNTEKRLNFLYPNGGYQLLVDASEELFTVSLTIFSKEKFSSKTTSL